MKMERKERNVFLRRTRVAAIYQPLADLPGTASCGARQINVPCE
jgi:hypothetical protein